MERLGYVGILLIVVLVVALIAVFALSPRSPTATPLRVRPLSIQTEGVLVANAVESVLEATPENVVTATESSLAKVDSKKSKVWASMDFDADNSGALDMLVSGTHGVPQNEIAQKLHETYDAAMHMHRETPLVTRSRETLDDLEALAESAGLTVDEFMSSQGLYASDSLSRAKNVARASEMFRAETSTSSRDIGTSSEPEVAALVREAFQVIPTTNEAMAETVMREVLDAYIEAANLEIELPKMPESHVNTLRMWFYSKRAPCSDLARSILSRLP